MKDDVAAETRGWSVSRVRLGIAAILLVLLVGAPFWAPLLLRQLSFFRVRKVEIVGARYVSAGDILERLHVDTNTSVWDPTGPLERRLVSHPQLRHVTVRRKLPGTLVVDIEENPPVAVVATNDGMRAFDARGVQLPIDLAKTPLDAPVLPRRDVGVLKLLGLLRSAAPALYDRVSEVRVVSADELLIDFDGTPVRAMRDVTADRFAEIDPVEDDLTRRGLRAAEIDLRYKDQVIARLP